MATLLDLDAELAAVLPTDLWYATSVMLRAEWRIQLTTPDTSRECSMRQRP